MVGILLITHAPLGRAFIEAVTHVYKDPPEKLEALDVIADQDPGEVRRLASEAITII
jgi:PTS system ascorbate-specific IIA component